MTVSRLFAAAALVGSMGVAGSALAQSVDPNLAVYQRASGVTGNISSIGSDTLNNLMTLWAEEFSRFYPNVNIQIQGAGSSTAPTALTEGTSSFGPMSRAMRDSEIEAFENRYGYEPYLLPVAIDTVAVYVHRDNPIEGLSLPEVDAIFSSTRLGDFPQDITRWGQVGLTGAWANRDITVYSRNAVSGTYGYFRDNALFGGDFKDSVNEQPGSSSVVQGVAESINGIGYSGIGYITSGVRAIPVGREVGGPVFEPNAENAASGDYPLSRFLYVYINKHPNEPLEPSVAEFVRMIFSQVGQEVVVRDGFIPVPASLANRVLGELGIQ